MIKAEYKKDLAHSYMIFKDCSDPVESGYQMKTLLANRIDGLLPMSVWHVDDQSGYRYEITGLQSFAAYCESVSFGPSELKRVYLGLLESLRRFEDYLLDPEHLLMDPEYLYIEWRSGKLFLPYVPSYSRPLGEKIRELTEYLLAKAEMRDSGSVLLLCSILRELKSGKAQLSDIQRCLGGAGAAGDGTVYPESRPVFAGSGLVSAGGGMVSAGSGLVSAGSGMVSAGSDSMSVENGAALNRYNAMPASSSETVAGDSTMTARNESMSFGRGQTQGGAGAQDGAQDRADVSGHRSIGAKIFGRFLPERYTVILAVFMAAAAAIVWGALQLQTTFIFSTAETAGCAALGAALIFLCARITNFVLDRHTAAAKFPRNSRDGIPYVGGAAVTPGAENADDLYQAAGRENRENLYAQGPNTSDDYWYEYDGDRFHTSDPYTDPFPKPAVLQNAKIESPRNGLNRWLDEGAESLLQSRSAEGVQSTIPPETSEDDFGQTVLLSDLAGGGVPASLTPADSNSSLPPFILEKRDLLFGQKKSMADRVIPDRSVSRLHARIAYRDGTYFIADMGSKNGTIVNGGPVVGREEVPLQDGARIRFAGCEYIFHEGV